MATKTKFPWPDMDIAMAHSVCGTPTRTSKMPCLSWSLPAKYCNVGMKLRHNNPDSVCAECYAMKGRYATTPVERAQENRWEKLEAALRTDMYRELYIIGMCRIIWNQNEFRWFDSGDIKNWEHLLLILEVCWRTPHIKQWIPTKEYSLMGKLNMVAEDFIPDNVNIRISAPIINDPNPFNIINGIGYSEEYTLSAVTTDHQKVTCPAYEQGGHCDGVKISCRKCWDRDIPLVIYPKH